MIHFTAPNASRTPTAAPISDSSTDSVSICLMIRPRVAPIDERNASSCILAVPRASIRIETLAQPITNSSVTAPNNSISVPENCPSICSLSVTTFKCVTGGVPVGSRSCHLKTSGSSSARAASSEYPAFSLMKLLR